MSYVNRNKSPNSMKFIIACTLLILLFNTSNSTYAQGKLIKATYKTCINNDSEDEIQKDTLREQIGDTTIITLIKFANCCELKYVSYLTDSSNRVNLTLINLADTVFYDNDSILTASFSDCDCECLVTFKFYFVGEELSQEVLIHTAQSLYKEESYVELQLIREKDSLIRSFIEKEPKGIRLDSTIRGKIKRLVEKEIIASELSDPENRYQVFFRYTVSTLGDQIKALRVTSNEAINQKALEICSQLKKMKLSQFLESKESANFIISLTF